MRDPGLTHKEDFASGTRSAAIGGVTTVADMPNTRPAVTRHRTLEDKISVLRGRACIDYALYAAPQEARVVSSLTDAAAFKLYLAESTGGLQVEPDAVPAIVDAAGREQKLVVVHAEDPSLLARVPGRDLRGHSTARPKEAEQKAISSLARVSGSARVHVAHATCIEALDAVPPGVTTEVTPLRSREDREALWEAFRAGRGDIVASDHAPHTLEEKEGPFEETPAGVPGVGSSFPLLMRRMRAGDIELPRLVSSMATRPAELLGIRKGSIEIGRDADLLAVDPRRIEKITAKRLHAKCDWTPFEGMEGCFPLAVYLRGEPIVEQGEPVADGRGRLLSPSA